jgi:hypothetical protein
MTDCAFCTDQSPDRWSCSSTPCATPKHKTALAPSAGPGGGLGGKSVNRAPQVPRGSSRHGQSADNRTSLAGHPREFPRRTSLRAGQVDTNRHACRRHSASARAHKGNPPVGEQPYPYENKKETGVKGCSAVCEIARTGATPGTC